MARVVLVALVLGLLSLSFVVALMAGVVWRLRRRNRLHPSVPTNAPLSWLVSPARASRLHRRLRLAVALAGYRGRRRSRRTLSRIDELAAGLTREAVNLDRRLVMASLAPRVLRRAHLDLLEPQVARIEQMAARLATLAGDRALEGGPSARLEALEQQVTFLETAQREVDDLEALIQLPGDPFSPRRLDRPA